jgi:hypothetical protein
MGSVFWSDRDLQRFRKWYFQGPQYHSFWLSDRLISCDRYQKCPLIYFWCSVLASPHSRSEKEKEKTKKEKEKAQKEKQKEQAPGKAPKKASKKKTPAKKAEATEAAKRALAAAKKKRAATARNAEGEEQSHYMTCTVLCESHDSKPADWGCSKEDEPPQEKIPKGKSPYMEQPAYNLLN